MVARTRLTVCVIRTLPSLLLAHFICSAKSAHVFIYNFSKTDFCTRTRLRYYEMMAAVFIINTSSSSSSSSSSSFSSIGTTAHCRLWPVEQCPSIFLYLPPTLSFFSLPALEDLFLLPLSIFSWVFPFFSSLPFLEWRSFWASYPHPLSLGDLTSLSFALLSILLYFLLCSSLLVLDSSDISIPRFHIWGHIFF